ncbi:hypothetical protein Goshw_011721 [Gossypium schwendimanii]|uniref:Uncharacterized protein n=1 Tax=Gossypium schwendimanii TaxID=34291 RepID=A0A7J9N4T0_GOSSC|nr:hypothetical protein [Gossypium schwendimanii]
MWEDRYDYIPTKEPIIVPELAAYRNTCHGLGSMASHIYYPQRRGSGNYMSEGKGKTRSFKSKTIGRRRWPLNEAQTFTRPIISGHSITRPNERSPEGPSGSSSFYQSPPPYGFQTPSLLVM